MKRSTMVKKIVLYLKDNTSSLDEAAMQREAETLLAALEKAGMSPPPVKAGKLPGFSGGKMCSMRCNCDDCNPNFIVHTWEEE